MSILCRSYVDPVFDVVFRNHEETTRKPRGKGDGLYTKLKVTGLPPSVPWSYWCRTAGTRVWPAGISFGVLLIFHAILHRRHVGAGLEIAAEEGGVGEL